MKTFAQKLHNFLTTSLVLFALATAGLSLQHKMTEYRVSRAEVVIANNSGGCSGTYVGHNTILTAEHCLSGVFEPRDFVLSFNIKDPEAVFRVNNGREFAVTHVELDGADHALITVGAYSEKFLKIDMRNQLSVGQKVFTLGHPGTRIIAKPEYGVYLGTDESIPDSSRWDLAGQPGCSGEALVDSFGRIVAVASLMDKQSFFITFPFRFTPAQIQTIK